MTQWPPSSHTPSLDYLETTVSLFIFSPVTHHPFPYPRAPRSASMGDTCILRISARKYQYHTRTVLTRPVRWSEKVHSTSHLGEVRAKEVCFNYQDSVLHHHGSQHTVSVSPHLFGFLRQARGCCGPIRRIPGPPRGSNICKFQNVDKYLINRNRYGLSEWKSKIT